MKKQTTDKPTGQQAGDQHISILSTKLHPPPLPADFVPRTELLEKLDKQGHCPLTLVSASAGYGKSLLISSWIKSIGIPAVWISLDEGDNDLRTFLSYLVTGIERQFPESMRTSGHLLEAVELPPLAELSNMIINELDIIDSAFMLVLDDYHWITEKPVHEFIEIVLRYPPQNFKLAILSRKDPPLPLYDLRAHSQVIELRMKELAFSFAEIKALFQKRHGFTLNDAVSQSLLDKTEGWVTGLRLAVLTINHVEDAQKLVDGMESDSLHLVSEFLIQEVLSIQAAATQKYLLKSSILNRFCAELLDELFEADEQDPDGITNGLSFLNWLNKSGMFLIPLDLENRWFRYHHLFQELLYNQLQNQQTADQIKRDHLTVSDWFEKHGLIEESIEHALLADDVERAAQIVEDKRHFALNSDQMFMLEKWLARLPDSVIQDRPGLLLARAWVFHHQLRFAEILPVIDRIEGLLKKGAKQTSLLGEVAFFRGYFNFFLNEGALSIENLKTALEQVPNSHQEVRAQSEIFFGLASQMQGQKDNAIIMLEDLLKSQPPPGDLRKTRLLATCIYIHIISGDLVKAVPYGRRFIEAVKGENLAYAEAWSAYLSGLLHFYRNEPEEAIPHLEQSVEQRFVHHDRAAVDSFIGLMLAYEAMGRVEDAEKMQVLLREYAASRRDPTYIALAEACQVRLAIFRRQVQPTIQWLSKNTPPSPEVMIWWLEIPCVTYCRALIAEGSKDSLDKAEKQLRAYVQMNETHHNICQLIQILPLLTIACEKQDKTEEALKILQRAVSLAQPGGFVFPFLECGLPMAELLQSLTARGEADYFIQIVLDAFQRRTGREKADSQMQPWLKMTANAPEGKTIEVENLTQREMEIITLLADGLKNKEIADTLYLSPTTIKKHIYNIYQKWDVHSRISVVTKAKDFGIIS